ncbi:hypothetical protein MNEG_14113, partial [Monoraphidium neglectum]
MDPQLPLSAKPGPKRRGPHVLVRALANGSSGGGAGLNGGGSGSGRCCFGLPVAAALFYVALGGAL